MDIQNRPNTLSVTGANLVNEEIKERVIFCNKTLFQNELIIAHVDRMYTHTHTLKRLIFMHLNSHTFTLDTFF